MREGMKMGLKGVMKGVTRGVMMGEWAFFGWWLIVGGLSGWREGDATGDAFGGLEFESQNIF
jgi:hypothetical protein